MIILAILATIVGVSALCWLLFNLAIYALPLFAAFAVGPWAHDTGAGIPGAIIVGALAAAMTFGLFPTPPPRRATFVTPAVVAGYHATLGIVKLTMPPTPGSSFSSSWRRSPSGARRSCG